VIFTRTKINELQVLYPTVKNTDQASFTDKKVFYANPPPPVNNENLNFGRTLVVHSRVIS